MKLGMCFVAWLALAMLAMATHADTAVVNPAASRTLVVDSPNWSRQGHLLPLVLPNSLPLDCSLVQWSRCASAPVNPAYPLRVQEAGEKWAAAVDFSLIPPGTLQPTIPKSGGLSGTNPDARQSLGRFLHMFHDPDGNLGLAEVVALDARSEMQQSGVEVPSLGYRSGATWVRLDLHNSGSTRQTRWLFINWPFQQHYDLYLTGADGQTRFLRSGAAIPIEQRPLASRYPLFPLELAPGEQVRAYLRVAGKASHVLDIQLWQPAELLDHLTSRLVWKYLGIGSTLIVLVFSAFLWRQRRQTGLLALAPAHLLTVLVVLGLDGMHADWIAASEENRLGMLVNAAGSLALFFHVQFARAFLDLRLRLPRLDHALALLAWLAQAGVGLAMLAGFTPGMLLPSMLLLSALTLTVMRAAWDGGINQRGYLAAWGLLFTGYVLRSAQVYGLLPDTRFIGDLPLFGLIAAVLVLSWTIYRDMVANHLASEAAHDLLLARQLDEQERLGRAVEARTAELRQALASAEVASRGKTIFLSSMSHELRTPLHTLLGFSALLKQKAPPDTRAQLAVIERSGRQLLRLIDDLLNFSSNEKIPITLHPEVVRLSALLDHLRAQGERMAAESGNRFRLEFDATLPTALYLDEARLLQVLLNLLGNACKYTHEGMISLRIAAAGPIATYAGPPPSTDSLEQTPTKSGTNESTPVTANHPAQAVLFEVIDNGPGIDPTDQARIFEPFVRLPDQSAHPGLGLGLGIARHWVRGMGGEISLVSAPDRGCRFSFTLVLPLAPPPDAEGACLPVAASLYDSPSPSAAIMAELRSMLAEGRLPALKLRAEALMREHPRCRDFLLNIQACCTSIDLPGLHRLLRQGE